MAKTLPVMISERAAATPDAVVIESCDTGATRTWRELDERCRTWADALRRLGVGPGEPVVTMMPQSAEASEAWLGCAWLRAVEVPTNTEYRGAWLVHLLNSSGARLVVASRRYVPQIAAVAPELARIHTVVVYDAEPGDEFPALSAFRVLTGEEVHRDARPVTDLPPPQLWDPACVIYTSGTTGLSKGVLIPWGMMVKGPATHNFERPEFEDTVFYNCYSTFHVTGKSGLGLVAIMGRRLVIRERFGQVFWDDIRGHGCTAAVLVGVIPKLLLQQDPQPDDADNPLRAVLMGPVVPEVDDFKERFGVPYVHTAYGGTEMGSVLADVKGVDGCNFRSCGHPLPGGQIELALVDEHDLPVGPNVVGELICRPREPWLGNLGYWGMPEATAAAWRRGWFHSGDGFMYDDNGDWYFVDRLKDCIRRRGENISSFEVEAAVHSHPAVLESAAVAVPAETVEDEVMVVVVPKPGCQLDPAELIEFLIPRMPRFAVPRFVEVADELPKTQATMRVQKVKLRERGVTPRTWDRVAAGIEVPR